MALYIPTKPSKQVLYLIFWSHMCVISLQFMRYIAISHPGVTSFTGIYLGWDSRMAALDMTRTRDRFNALIAQIIRYIGDRPLDAQLEDDLNRAFPAGGPEARALLECCQSGVAEGWMCARESGGIRFGRVIKPDPATGGFSVDVVEMQPVAGPHHRHPNGEIDFIMPLESDAQFDGRGAGWLIYGPGSAHSPTVTCGRAMILYLLPQGAIEFTKS